MPGPFHSSQYRTAKKARASASPSKPSASSSSRLDAGGSSLKTTSKTTSSAASSILSSVKSTSRSNAANALKAKLAQGKVKPHSSFKPSSTKPRLNSNSNGVSKARVREIAENTEKARQAALQDIAKSKAREKEKEKDKSAMVGSSTTARRSSTAAAGSNPGSTRQNATASSSSSSVPQTAPPQTAPMPVQGGAAVGGVPMYYPAPVNIMYPQVPYPQPQPFVPNANRRGSAYYNALPSPVEGPAAATITFRDNTPATAPSPTAPVNVGVLHQDLTSLYHASDQLFGRMTSVLQVQEVQGRTIQAMQGQCTALVESQGEDRRAMQAGFDLILKELREEREESRQWRQAHTKLCGALAGDQTATRKEVAEVGKWLGRPKDERDSRSLFERMEGVEWGIGEIGLILGDPEANMPEGSDSVQRPPRPLVQSQPEPGPSTVAPRQLNTRDEPIEIDMDEPSTSTSTSYFPIPEPHQRPQEVQPQEPEQQLAWSSTSGSAAPSSSTAPDLHILLGLNTGVPPQSSQSSTLHSPHEAFDFDLEYPPDSSQAGATSSQKRRSKTPEPSPSRIALDEGAQEEDEKDKETETPMLVEEERSKTPEPDPLPAAALAVQRTPTQASIVPSSSTTSTLAASTSATTALSTSTSTCTRDKSALHFSRVDWDATDPSPVVSMTSPYKPDAETLSKTPIEKRVSSTVPPPPPGTVAELRLEIVGCAPYVGSGLTLDRNDQLVVEGPGGQMSDAGASAHVPLVTRPSVSPLPSPATTPSRSRAATPVGIKRTESMSTVVAEEEEEDSMQVDDSATREDETRMQIDGAQRIDPTLDILARNLKEVQNLEEERKRIEAELAQEKALKDKEEERRKREEEEAEEKKRAAEEAEKAERERVKRELEEARLKAEAEAKEKTERERRDKELAEVLRLKRVEAEAEREKREKEALLAAKLEAKRKEREDEERLAEEARVRREDAERAKAEVDRQAFEQEEKERREAIEQQVKARFDAEAEEKRKKIVEEKEKAAQQEEEGEEVLGGKVYDVLRGQEEPVQDDQQQDLGYDLELDFEPQPGIDPIYTQLGGPTPAQSQQSINLSLSPEIMPASTSALPHLSPVRPLIAASSYEAFTVESILSSQEDIEVPDKIDDRVDTSDEGEQDELQEGHDMDQLNSSPTSPIFGSSFNFNTTPHDSEGAQNKPAHSSSESGTEKVTAQNRTISYTPKSFMGARSQPLLEIVNNSPQRSVGNVDGEDDEKLEKRTTTDSVLVVLGPEEDEASRIEGERGGMLPPPSPSVPLGDELHDDDDDEAMDETYAAGAVFAVHDPPNDDMDEDEPPLAESPQEQLFLPGDDDDELSFPPSRPKSSLSLQVQTRDVSEEVPEATSTPKPKVAPKPVPSALASIPRTTSASISASAQGPPRTPSRTRAYSGMSTPIHLSAGSGLGGRMDSHPASKTLVPTPSRKGALSRRLEEENRNRERSNSVASSIVVSKRSIVPLPSTPKVKPTTPARASTSTKGKTAPTPSAEVIEISSSPEASPNVARTNAQDVISKRARRLEAKKREKERDKDVKVKKESMGEKGKGRTSTASGVVIDLTSDKDEDDDEGGSSNKAKAKGKQSTKEPTEDKGDSGSDSDPPIDGDSDDSAEIVATVPLRRNPIQATRTGSSSSQQPSRSIADRLKKPGYSAAATRLKSLPMKRPKDGDSGDDRPMKRAREAKAGRGGFVPTIGTVKTRPVSASIASGSSKVSDRGKRKERDHDDDSVVVKKERTLNAMGRGGRGSSTTSTVASSSKTRESGNAKTLRQRTVDLEAEPVKWPPANKHGNRKFQRDFIECDMCNGWYHYGCVGIKEDDPRIRMQDPESFMCPRCEMGLDAPHRTKEERERCGRPNCIQRAPKSNEYYVERLVGRKYSGMGASYSWLVKWDGYPLEQCTWQTEKDMAEPMKLIEAFTEAAEKEERDLGNPYKRILLSEVEKSGWIDPDK